MAVLLKPGELVAPEESLFLPGGMTPRNFLPGPGVKVEMVTSDMYNVCTQLQELNPRLFVHEVTGADGGYHYFSIVERTPIEGGYKDELVFTTEELDGRAVDYARYLLKVPLDERLKAIEKIEDDHKKVSKENELNQLYEDFGGPMLRQLYHDGFVHGAKPGAGTPYRRDRGRARKS